jgi:L-threonylcarbamoyladenylate synthase
VKDGGADRRVGREVDTEGDRGRAGGPILRADPASVARAADALIAGQLVAFPAETVYGLGGDAGNPLAVAQIYQVKGRPAGHPLIVHVIDSQSARRWAHWTPEAERLAAAFWPGPLTLILNRLPEACGAACGGQRTIGLRAPAHPVSIQLLDAFAARGGSAIAAPSANRFGRVSPTRAQHVLDDLGLDAPLILDGGDCAVGLESTIVDLSGGAPALLRPGGLVRSEIERALGRSLAAPDQARPQVSGALAAHYAPRTALEMLSASAIELRLEALASVGLTAAVWSRRKPGVPCALWVEQPADPGAAGQQLYAALRDLDRAGVSCLLIESAPPGEAWRAIDDRLGRAVVGSGSSADRLPYPPSD